MTERQSSPSESEKQAAFLAELEAERQRRIGAGTWSRGTLPRLMAVVDGESEEVSQQRALYAYLAEHPDAPKSIAAYRWIINEVLDPAPTVELPDEQYAPDHGHAVDVTPPPSWQPPMPSPPLRSARSLPPAPGAGALSVDPRNVNIPARIHDAEQRRTRNFNDDTWGNPSDWPIRYPRGNRNGW